MEGEISTTKVDVILLGSTATSHLVGPVVDIREVPTTLLVNFSTTGGILIRCQTLEGYLMGVPTIINLAFNHEVQSSLGQRFVIIMEVKVI